MIFPINTNIIFSVMVIIFSFDLMKVLREPNSLTMYDVFILAGGSGFIYKHYLRSRSVKEKTILMDVMLKNLNGQLLEIIKKDQDSKVSPVDFVKIIKEVEEMEKHILYHEPLIDERLDSDNYIGSLINERLVPDRPGSLINERLVPVHAGSLINERLVPDRLGSFKRRKIIPIDGDDSDDGDSFW